VTRIAVIIPTHDDGELAVDAVASVRESEPVELVVIDDGSTKPEALAALDRLRENGTTVLRIDNSGLPAARRVALDATSAPFVFPLDADDLAEPGALGALADLLEAHPEAGFAWGDYHEFGDKDEHYRAPSRWLPWSATYLNLWIPSIMFRREAIAAAGHWPPMYYEDWGLLLGCVEAGIDGVYLDRVVYRRRIQASSMLTRARRDHAGLYDELKRRYPGAFARRRELARVERPALWKRVLYPVVYGRRTFVPAGLETRLRRSRFWTLLRPLRR
jgi:glycosyltransferase involved in cell wall biosynthesis